jgi:hypothetical protein
MNCQVCNIHYFSCKQAYERHMKSKRHQNVVNSINNEGLNMYQCVDCLKFYASRSVLSHHKKICTKRTQSTDEKLEEMQTKIETYEKEHEMLRAQIALLLDKHSCDNSTNSHNTNNIDIDIGSQTNNNLHVHINSFGNENLDYITNDFIHGCVNRIYESVPTIVEKMHFDPAHPENHNFKIPNKKLPHASVMSEDQKWKLMDRQEAINNMIDKGYNIIDSQFREDPSKFSESKRRHYRRFQENYDTEDKDTMKRIRSDVELVVLNGTREIHK